MVVNINGNWIKLFTKFVAWEWYKDQNTKALFIHCLLKANWKDGKFEGNIIPRGSFVTSLDSLNKELGLSVQEIRTALKHLISTNELTSKSTNKYRIITVVNYELYQQHNKQLNNQLTSNQQTTNNQLTTIEEYIEYKTKEEYKNNSVCNKTPEENFSCHLGCLYKTLDCKNCMKKWKCPLPDDPTFKGINGKTFYEYVAEIELRKLEVAKELEVMGNNINQELTDYDWLNDKGDEK